MAFLFALKTALFRIALGRYLVAGLVKNDVFMRPGQLFPRSPFGFGTASSRKAFSAGVSDVSRVIKTPQAKKKDSPPYPPGAALRLPGFP